MATQEPNPHLHRYESDGSPIPGWCHHVIFRGQRTDMYCMYRTVEGKMYCPSCACKKGVIQRPLPHSGLLTKSAK